MGYEDGLQAIKDAQTDGSNLNETLNMLLSKMDPDDFEKEFKKR